MDTDTAVTAAGHHELVLDVQAGHAAPLLAHLDPLAGQDWLLHLLLVQRGPVVQDHLPAGFAVLRVIFLLSRSGDFLLFTNRVRLGSYGPTDPYLNNVLV